MRGRTLLIWILIGMGASLGGLGCGPFNLPALSDSGVRNDSSAPPAQAGVTAASAAERPAAYDLEVQTMAVAPGKRRRRRCAPPGQSGAMGARPGSGRDGQSQ